MPLHRRVCAATLILIVVGFAWPGCETPRGGSGGPAAESDDPTGSDRCAFEGRETGVCTDGRPDGDECRPPTAYEVDEQTCDRRDNDCDGIVDGDADCPYTAQIEALSVEEVLPAEDGGVFVAGTTSSAIGDATHRGNRDAVVARYGPHGQRRWLHMFGTADDDRVLGGALHGSGLVVCGETDGTFESPEDDVRGDRGFVTTFDGDGDRRWSNQFGKKDARCQSIDTGPEGTIYITGRSSDDEVFDGALAPERRDGFLVRYDAEGRRKWVRRQGTDGPMEAGGRVVVDSTGHVYQQGLARGPLGDETKPNDTNIYTVRYDPTGKREWVRWLSEPGSYLSATTPDDELFVLGVEEHRDDTFSLVGARVAPDGETTWRGELELERGLKLTDIQVGADGRIHVVGASAHRLDGSMNERKGWSDTLAMTLTPELETVWLRQLGTPTSDYWSTVGVGDDGTLHLGGDSGGTLDAPADPGEKGRSFGLIAEVHDGTFQRDIPSPERVSVATSDDGSTSTDDTADDCESTREVCNGTDDDCDGVVDERCLCRKGGDEARGVCRYGLRGRSGTCRPGHLYESEERSCDRVDNDCDGEVDEGGLCPVTRFIGGRSMDGVKSMTTDGNGHVYLLGNFTWAEHPDLDDRGDVVLLKYTTSGEPVWVADVDVNDDQHAGVYSDVATGPDGGVYISVKVAQDTDGHTVRGTSDMALVKFSPEGDKRWQRLFGTAEFEAAAGIAVGEGGVYLGGETTGRFSGETDHRGTDGFVVKYSLEGDHRWSRQFVPGASTEVADVALDDTGAVYGVGAALHAFDGEPPNKGWSDGFVVKLGPDGTLRWAYQFPGMGSAVHATVGHPAGGVAVTGNFVQAGIATHDDDGRRQYSHEQIETRAEWIDHLTSPSKPFYKRGNGLFVAHIGADGEKQWFRTTLAPDAPGDKGTAIDVGPDGDLVVAGRIVGTADGTDKSTGIDAFVGRYAPDGPRRWFSFVGGSEGELAMGVALSDDRLLVAGNTSSNFDGEVVATRATGTPKLHTDAFLAVFNGDGTRFHTDDD